MPGQLPPRTNFDSRRWLQTREPSRRSMWLMRGGIVLAMGAFGTLGWIGYRQMPNTAAASEDPAGQTLVLDGDTAEQPTTRFVSRDAWESEFGRDRQHGQQGRANVNPFATEGATPVRTADPSAEIVASPFERPTPSRRQAATEQASQSPRQSNTANPFAEFAKAKSEPVEATTEITFDAKSSRHKSAHRPQDDIVTLASNERHAAKESPGTVEVADDRFKTSAAGIDPSDANGTGGSRPPLAGTQTAPGQYEPAVIDFQAAQSGPATPAEVQPPTAASDPFAAFATQPTEPAGSAPSSVPGSFGSAAQSEPAARDPWNTAPPSQVTPAQFQAEPAPLAPGGFEAQAKPIDAGSPFETQQSPALSRPAAATDWPPAEHQPAAVEPMTPRRGKTKPTYSPGVERVSSTSGFNVPQPVVPANDPRDEKLHVVQQGETWWSISRQHYGAGRYFQALAEYNKPRISDQQQLKPGMKVLVPSANTLEVRFDKQMQASGLARPAAKPKSGLQFNAQGQPFYVVGEGDTLGEIATRYLGKTLRSDEIYRLNQQQLPTPNSLKVGMILAMPVDAAESQPASSVPRGR